MHVCLCGEEFPRIERENLLGQKAALPDAAAGHPVVVAIGFTHSSQNQTKAWAARLQHEFPTYSIAVLEDAPRLVRGVAVHGLKGQVPEELGRIRRPQRCLRALVGQRRRHSLALSWAGDRCRGR